MPTITNAMKAPPSSCGHGMRTGKACMGSTFLPNQIAIADSPVASTAAGTSPARNRPPIEILATKPMMIRFTHGGIVSAITAEQASTAAVSLTSCFVRRTAGTTMPPTAAISASLEPDTPEKKAVARMEIRFIEPRTRPNIRTSNSIRRVDMPFDSMIRPASTKKGIASSTK